ncbi:MAG: hypothetical protein AB7F51_04860 [Pseudorhodoplanes sp.]
MRLWTISAVTALAAGVLGLLLAEPASAQTPQEGVTELSSQSSKRTRTRVVVRQRSYLDAGTEVQPGERKFMDYALPPNYSVLESALGPGQNFWRQPLNNPWDVPSSRW